MSLLQQNGTDLAMGSARSRSCADISWSRGGCADGALTTDVFVYRLP
jgi:hypothetical protein